MNTLEAGQLDCPKYNKKCRTVNCRAWTELDEDNGFCCLHDLLELGYYKSQSVPEESNISPWKIRFRIDEFGNVEV